MQTYNINLSVFTSIPDLWGIDQLFPIVPIHKLDQRPVSRRFIGGESSLPLHELDDGGGSAPGKTDMHGLIMGSSKDICSLFDSYLPNHEASTHEITLRMFSTQLRSSSTKNQIKRSSYVTVMPFTNQATFRNPSFGGPVSHIKHQLKSGDGREILLAEEKSSLGVVKIFEADQRRLFSQFEVREFCDNLVEGVVKALNDVSKSENNLEDLKDFSDSLPIFDEYDEEDFEEKSFDYPHQGPLLDTRRPLDDGLGPIFDEVDELGPTFDEKAPSMTSINMENHLCFDPGTTPTPLTTDIQEHCEKLDFINYLSQINCAITCPETILVYNTYFDRLHDDLKCVLHILGKETLVSYLNKINRISLQEVPGTEAEIVLISLRLEMEGGNDVPLGSAPGKTDMNGLIMGSSNDICSLFDSYLPNQEASTHEITCRMFSTQLRSSSKKNKEFICDSYAIYKSGDLQFSRIQTTREAENG
uniref:Arginine decarboxylase n=1 Tax=Brassica oleracea var. oleracea TaxID=109376 RepID=A0A0D3BLB8_BRAOL